MGNQPSGTYGYHIDMQSDEEIEYNESDDKQETDSGYYDESKISSSSNESSVRSSYLNENDINGQESFSLPPIRKTSFVKSKSIGINNAYAFQQNETAVIRLGEENDEIFQDTYNELTEPSLLDAELCKCAKCMRRIAKETSQIYSVS
jgi:hypothetical protein